jgi:hypothetical protein
MMSDSPACVERSVRLYATITRAYPASFRKEYADEMVLVFHDMATEAWQKQRRIGLLILWFHVLGDFLCTAPKEHLRACNARKGGLVMEIKSLLTRKIVPDPDFCWLLIVSVPIVLLSECCILGKLMSMNITESQRFLGILLAAVLALQLISIWLLTPLGTRKGRPKHHASVGQISLWGVSLALLIGGVRMLGLMAVTEYELILGLLMLFELMVTLIGMAQILPLLQNARDENRESTPHAPREVV